MTHLKEAVVLITGANGGFGQQLIRQCLSLGSKLILTDLASEPLQSCAASIQQEVKTGQILQTIGADLSTREGCEELYRQIKQVPDILINNAGIANFGRFDEIPAEKWELLMQVNLLAPMRLVSLFTPTMIERRRGHIVNISSVAGWIGTAGLAPYSAAKHGLRGFGEALSEELRPYDIKVTTVFPFFSRTPILNAPSYGSLERTSLPDKMTTDPADVVREVLKGIEHNRALVFPDPFARRLQWLKRHLPGLIPILNRRSLSKG